MKVIFKAWIESEETAAFIKFEVIPRQFTRRIRAVIGGGLLQFNRRRSLGFVLTIDCKMVLNFFVSGI